MRFWNSRFWISLLSVLGVVLASLAITANAETYSPRVGERHLNFTLPAIDDGRPLSLEPRGTNVGKPVKGV